MSDVYESEDEAGEHLHNYTQRTQDIQREAAVNTRACTITQLEKWGGDLNHLQNQFLFLFLRRNI